MNMIQLRHQHFMMNLTLDIRFKGYYFLLQTIHQPFDVHRIVTEWANSITQT